MVECNDEGSDDSETVSVVRLGTAKVDDTTTKELS